MRTFLTLLKIEGKLSIRGLDMLIFAIAMPLAATVLFGMLSDGPFADRSHTLLEQSFAAIATISLAAGGLMGLPLVISDYRQRGILKRFQTCPVRPATLLSAQIAMYALYALVSLFLIYACASLFFDYRLQGSWLIFAWAYLLVMLTLFSIGLLVGGLAPNPKIAGVFASLLYFPMLLLSGATLPYEIMPGSLQRVADILPLTQGIKLMKTSALGQSSEIPAGSIVLLSILCIGCTAIALRYFRWRS